MIAKQDWTQSNAQQNIGKLQNPRIGVTINNESTTTEPSPKNGRNWPKRPKWPRGIANGLSLSLHANVNTHTSHIQMSSVFSKSDAQLNFIQYSYGYIILAIIGIYSL